MSKSEIRKDYFKDEYVIIAPGRAKRPHLDEKLRVNEGGKGCHFCPENFKNETITYQDNGYNGEWEILSVVNKFSALTLDNPNAFGQTEVVIETRKHGMDINDFSVDHIVRVFNCYIDRFLVLRNMDKIRHVIIFKNEGGKAGASIPHTHSQIIALPVLPLKNEKEGRDYNKYRLEHVTCPYCDVIKKETDKPRVIWEDENLFALSPFASNAPFGAWLLPKRHVRLISELTRSEKESIAIAMKIILGKLDELGMSYNYFIENAVNNEDYHMHIKIMPRPNIWAGLELGTGIIINPVSPEHAANVYRSKVGTDDKAVF